ncbi:hypothetical protein CK203_060993 [Vitis vinifera]|uniref:Uncharacterized protein n=1 Tax=Vitis vinifera TaxID=29760 RepID=A0A438G6P5_VITVI|nr:hypothetical protein CK203_060993 [Vitis vinifera]
MMPLGGGRAIITLRATDRDRGRRRGCQRSWEALRLSEIVGGDLPSFLSFRPAGGGTWVVVGCQNDIAKRKKSIYDESSSLGIPRQHVFSINGTTERVSASNTRAVTVTAPRTSSPFFQFYTRAFSEGFDHVLGALGFLLPPYTFCGLPILLCGKTKVWVGNAGSTLAPVSRMSAKKEATSSSSSRQSGKVAFEDVYTEKSVDKLNVREFCERFCIPNGVSVELMDGEVVSTEKSTNNAIYFTKEQFNAGLRFPLPSLFKEFLHFTQIPPAYIHPNMVRVLMGCSVMSVLFDLDLSLLEVIFIYSIKKGKNDIHSFVASLPSLQLVTSLPDSTKGAARGHMLVKGLWAGKERRGKVVEWVEKASFDRFNRLFEIVADERSCETLLST